MRAKQTINRLILIGNGFDRAHGLKTGYNDFIRWYLSERFKKAFEFYKYSDDLIDIAITMEARLLFQKATTVEEYLDDFYSGENGFKDLIENLPRTGVEGDKTISPYFSVTVKSDLLKSLLLNCNNTNWVDIENEFYSSLKSILTAGDKRTALDNLNKSLRNVIGFLDQYLQGIPKPQFINEFVKVFNEPVKKCDLAAVWLDRDIKPTNTQVLNFNYTSTLEQYTTESFFKPENPTKMLLNFNLNYIHGKLDDPNNKLIFGFGDELDDNYLQMERETTHGFLEYIKSFWYFKTANYHKLIKFLDTDEFQVFILGHSCGLSDRTMLNMIFEHENCRSIKIFYHGSKEHNNHTNLTQEISKHFRNKVDMREKIVPFTLSSPIPQISK